MAEANEQEDLGLLADIEDDVSTLAAIEASEPAGNDLPETEQQATDRIVEGAEDTPEKKPEKTWGPEEIQGLLIKAINYRSPLQDIATCIKCGADVNRAHKNGLFPIHYAAYTDYFECVKFLLNYGANVNATDDIGYTPLHLASRCGNYRTMSVLIENGAIVSFNEPGRIIHNTDEKNKLGYSTAEPINLAIQNGHKRCAKLLLENGARVNNKYFMGDEICLAPLEEVGCLELLLEYGADPDVFNRCGLCPLMKACKGHHIDAVRVLLRYGADVNAQCPPLFEQKSVLQFAIISGNIVIINLLLAKKARVERNPEYQYAALHTAVLKGRSDIVRVLLQYNADPNEKAEEGATPLMLACGTPELKDREEIVALLIRCGADVNAHGPSFSISELYLSPLTEYMKHVGNTGEFSIVKTLIQNGARVNFCEGERGLPVHRRVNPFSILQYAHCMADNPDIFELTIEASSAMNPLAIYACDSLPENMKNEVLLVATQPRSLKHLTRLAIHNILLPELPDKVESLPLPDLLKNYVLYK